jgi:two-component system, OmpR family, response regulator VicR
MRNGLMTTSEVAKMCSVSVRTVHMWMAKGLLKGFRIPGSLHRRVERRVVEEFARSNGLPLKRERR